MTDLSLPAEFAILDHLVVEWSLATNERRATKRVETDIKILQQFFDEVEPHIENIILYLNHCPNDPEALTPDVKRLFHLAQTFMEVAAPIDLEWPSGDIEDSFPMKRFGFLM